MSESPSRRAADWPPPDERGGGRGQRPDGYGQRANAAQSPWEPQPRSAQRPAGRDERTRRGGYDDGYGSQGGRPGPGGGSRGGGQADYDGNYDDGGRGGGGSRAGGRGYDDGYGDPRGQRGASGSGGYDDDHDEAPPRGGTRRAGGGSRGASGGSRAAAPARGRGGAPTGPAVPLGQRLGIAFAIGAVPSLIVAFLCGAASAGGSSRSIAGVTLNSQLLTYSALAIPATMAIIAGLLHWRRITPLGLTWGFTVVAGLSWLSLLFAAQVKNVIPHLTPLLTVPLVTGLAVLAGAYLTDENTPPNGRYACLAAVIASHIGIVAIVVTIVLA
ncbi:hypothetical protein GCM10009839_05820 [Catenulispora yoronensis]|uniref:YIP1 family protein n=1 Tax=Catenulispora yoronensis TaxID=450799 RepID=A0ABN2TMG7_9ACTN